MTVPVTALHHVRIPVEDLDGAVTFWDDVLGFAFDFEFPDRAGVAVRSGSASVVLWHDPVRARAAAGSVVAGIGVPGRDALEGLARDLDARGIPHGGIQPAFADVKLPFVELPGGALVGFYVMAAAA